jgi:hypothetical protein
MAKRRGRRGGGRHYGRRRSRRGVASHSIILTSLGIGTALIPLVMPPSGSSQSALNYLLAGNLGMALWSLVSFVVNNWTYLIGPVIILILAAAALKHVRVRITKHWRA